MSQEEKHTHEENKNDKKKSRGFFAHWPTILLGLLVAAVFIIAIFSFTVKSTELAVITTFGKVTKVIMSENAWESRRQSVRNDKFKIADGVEKLKSGLHFRWPYPIQEVKKYDGRLRAFDGNVGKIDETPTKDQHNLIIGIFTIYRIYDPVKFFNKVSTVIQAEESLNAIMRSVKNNVIGQFDLDQIINANASKMKIAQIQEIMKNEINRKAMQEYGIQIDTVGIKTLGIPEATTKKVIDRMVEERKKVAQTYRSDGKRKSDKIRSDARNKSKEIIADAKANAKMIRAEADAQAAAYYAEFKKSPALAAFLRKLESLKMITKDKTTLILDNESAPFDILKLDADKIEPMGINKNE